MEINLTETELAAKEFVLHLMLKGLGPDEPCDKNFDEDDFKLPTWYDEAKFKRGQKYFMDNRGGIMLSNLYGLFSLISEPLGAKLLDRTGKSSTPAAAKKRYISTTLRMLSWYRDELKPGTKSWESLKKVRKMHLFASKMAEQKGLGNIPQTAMAMTNFGFMGFALVRPHLLGVAYDNDEDREAFVFMWAVIGSMLGIKDEFNMCLHSLPVVETICRIFIRYAFIPFLQLETPTFKKLGKAFIEGMSLFLPFSSYESRLFLARRLAGVPGYQYQVDMEKENIQRQIFTPEESRELTKQFQEAPGHEYRRNMVFDENFYLLEIKRIDDLKSDSDSSEVSLDNMDENRNIFGYYTNTEDPTESNKNVKHEEEIKYLLEILDLKHPSELLVTLVDEENFKMYLNDRKFHELSYRDQQLVKAAIRHEYLLRTWFGKPIIEAFLSLSTLIMEKYDQNQK